MTKELTPQQRAAQELLTRQKARDNLLTFTEYTHPSWDTGEHHRLVCKYLQKVESGEIKRLAIFAPPRHSKSELASRRFPAWYLGRHPDRQIICASAGGDLANDIGADVRDIVRDPLFGNVFPECELRADQAAAGRWRTSEGGIYYAIGVGGMVVGRGAHLAVIDDPHKGRDEADSARMRDVVSNWFYGDMLTRLMNPEAILLMMTRWHEDDLAGRLLPPEAEWVPLDKHGRVYQAADWTVVRLRAIEEDSEGREHPLWPGSPGHHGAGYPIQRLRRIRNTMLRGGRFREWNAQYQQNPVSEEGTYIKREWLDKLRWTKEPERADEEKGLLALPEYMAVYIAGDFAVTDKTASNDPDYTEFGVFGVGPDDKIYVIDWWGGQVTPNVWLDKLLDLIQKHEPYAFYGEAGAIRRSVESILNKRADDRRIAFVAEWIPSTKDKTVRGRAFQAWAASERIVFPEEGTRFPSGSAPEEIIGQCVAFPTARHDDRFDVMATICAVVDKMDAASIPVKRQKKKRDRWRPREEALSRGWKVI